MGLRPTRQRLDICEVLFDRKETFHFTIDDLRKILKTKVHTKISIATIYNTINSFKHKGYIKEISLNSVTPQCLKKGDKITIVGSGFSTFLALKALVIKEQSL